MTDRAPTPPGLEAHPREVSSCGASNQRFHRGKGDTTPAPAAHRGAARGGQGAREGREAAVRCCCWARSSAKPPPPPAETGTSEPRSRSTVPSPTGGRKALRPEERQRNEQSEVFGLCQQPRARRIPVTQTAWGCPTALERRRGIAQDTQNHFSTPDHEMWRWIFQEPPAGSVARCMNPAEDGGPSDGGRWNEGQAAVAARRDLIQQ